LLFALCRTPFPSAICGWRLQSATPAADLVLRTRSRAPRWLQIVIGKACEIDDNRQRPTRVEDRRAEGS
jgi:hypothetical protein